MKTSDNSLFDYMPLCYIHQKISVSQIIHNRNGKLHSLISENFIILNKLVMVH